MKRPKAFAISLLWLLLFFGVRIGISAAVAISGSGGFENVLQTVSDNAAKILLLCNIITPLLILLTVKLNGNRLSDSLGMKKTGLFGLLVSAVLATVATPVVRFLVGLIRFPESITAIYDKFSGIAVFKNSALPILTAALLMPLCEELIFRGALFNTLNSAFTKFSSVFLTTLFFAFIYPDPREMLFAFAMGILFSLIYIRFDSLWAAITAHIFCILIYKYFDINVYRKSLQYGVLTLCGAAVISVLIWMLTTGIENRRSVQSEADE